MAPQGELALSAPLGEPVCREVLSWIGMGLSFWIAARIGLYSVDFVFLVVGIVHEVFQTVVVFVNI